jgi:hypothetical protein
MVFEDRAPVYLDILSFKKIIVKFALVSFIASDCLDILTLFTMMT